jgi:MFS family permease
VRKQSLLDIGIPESGLEKNGLFLLNIQMIGMLLGGLLWGILGDKKGRLKVLFGSILLYSLANIANAFVHSVEMYAALRFIAGFGLAGELGAGITLVSEIMHKDKRGWSTTLIATVGVSGAILAGILGNIFEKQWSIPYIIGGVLGLALLLLRFGVFESGMYEQVKTKSRNLGSLQVLFSNKLRLRKYLKCILIGLPIWYTIGILITFSPELGKLMGIQEKIKPGNAIMFCYTGVTLGDLMTGLMSQWIKSRRKVLMYFVLATFVMVIAYFIYPYHHVSEFYGLMIVLGFAAGYWAVLMVSTAEQFGTNIRATATTSVPNFIRGALTPITLFYVFLQFVGLQKLNAALLTGIICCSVAFIASYYLDETFGKDLDFTEGDTSEQEALDKLLS